LRRARRNQTPSQRRKDDAMDTVKFRNIKEFSYAKKESLRTLKTNLQFCGDDVRVVMFTSSFPNEGKSTIAFDLAMSLTESGKRVLLVDTDLRGSVLVGQLRAKAEEGKKIVGLSHYLSGQKSLEEVVYETKIPKLHMVFAGPSVPNPTEILEKRYFEKLIEYGRENYDYVLVDCAPIGAVIDAAIVAKQCDGAVLVIAQGMAGTKAIMNSKKQLEAAGIKILGVVLNKCKTEKHHYGKYYGRYYGKYYGGYGYYGNNYYGDNSEQDTKGIKPSASKIHKRDDDLVESLTEISI
jgi:capsular exopolysaccharide synthesis family protein